MKIKRKIQDFVENNKSRIIPLAVCVTLVTVMIASYQFGVNMTRASITDQLIYDYTEDPSSTVKDFLKKCEVIE